MATSPLSEPQPEDDELDLAEIMSQVLARKWLIIFLIAVAAALGAFIGQLEPNRYRASALVQIEERSSGVPLPEELIGKMFGQNAEASSFDTQVHIIRSRLILEPVVADLDLTTRVLPVRVPVIGDFLARRDVPAALSSIFHESYQRTGENLSVTNVVVDDSMIGATFTLTVQDENRVVVVAPSGETVAGPPGEVLEIPGVIRLTVSELAAPAGRQYHLFQEHMRHSVARVRGGLSVQERGRTGIVDFHYSSPEPALSRQVVNAVVASYQAQNLNRRSAEIDQSIAFIEEQIPAIRRDLEVANARLAAYRQEQGDFELSLGTQELLNQVVQIQSRLEELNFEEEQIAQQFTQNHPDYQRLLAERARLEDRLNDLRADLDEIPEAEQELARLQERVIASQELERKLTARVEQLEILRASTVGNIRVLEPAEEARLVGPSRTQPALLGLVIGLVGAVGLVLLLNFLRRGIEDARDIEPLGVAVLGSITKVARLQGKSARDPEYKIASLDPSNVAVESLRGLRTGLQFSLSLQNAKTVMVTSCSPADGKSFVSTNLAIVSAAAGARVLLVDADLRRGRLGRAFNVTRTQPGLTRTLTQESTLEDSIFLDQETGVEFMSTGGYPPNPAELLSARVFDELIATLAERYDLVIFDAPPVLAVSDPLVIGQKVDATLMVVRHLVTTKAELQNALKSLASVSIKPSGVVLNAYDASRSRYGRYGSKYGAHYGAYSYKYDSK